VKSLTIDLKQNPRSARDALKAKFKDREQQSGSYSPMAANNYKATSNLGVKPQSIIETTVSRLAAKYLNNTKSPSNRQAQPSTKVEKPKPSPELKSRKPGTG
jgi:dTDP-D-glucose 4,6-dehydratase